jgi:hypothetical protein
MTGSRNPFPIEKLRGKSGMSYLIEELTASMSLLPYTFLLFLSCSVNKLRNFQMLRNLPAMKLAMSSCNPYPIEELMASPSLALNNFLHFSSCCSVLSKISKMPKCRVILPQ